MLDGGLSLCEAFSLPPRAITAKAKASPASAGLAFALVVIRLGFEPKTHSLEGCCSIQVSYRTDPYFASVVTKVGAKICFFFDICKKSYFLINFPAISIPVTRLKPMSAKRMAPPMCMLPVASTCWRASALLHGHIFTSEPMMNPASTIRVSL